MVIALLACTAGSLGTVNERAMAVAGQAIEPIIPGATLQFYEIEGSSRQELLSAMDRAEITDYSGDFVYAKTNWYVSADGPTADPKIDYITVTLPRWRHPEDAEDHLVEAWRKFVTRLIQHEANHVRLVHEALPDIEQALRNGPTASARWRFESALEELRQRERDYDSAASHGETEGAVWDSVPNR